MSSENVFYYGDNLEILPRYIDDESVDLIYLDPPFNSNQDYNVLFADKSGTRSEAQIKVFEDTWQWDTVAALQCFQSHQFRGARFEFWNLQLRPNLWSQTSQRNRNRLEILFLVQRLRRFATPI